MEYSASSRDIPAVMETDASEEFVISKMMKLKAKKIRIRNESKFKIPRLIKAASLLISAVCFVLGIFVIPYSDNDAFGICAVGCAVFLIIAVIAHGIMSNWASHWITTRLNERLWISNGKLSHFFQTAFAGGLNIRHADETGYLFVIDIETIRDAKYDPKSKRVEFHANGKGYHYSNIYKLTTDREWALDGYKAVFYNYVQPDLVDTLEANGVTFTRCTLDFSVRDASI